MGACGRRHARACARAPSRADAQRAVAVSRRRLFASGNRRARRQEREFFQITGRARHTTPARNHRPTRRTRVMSDRNRPLNRVPLDLTEALRALPLQAPDRSAWPELAEKLSRESATQNHASKRSERFRLFIIPAALAAALASIFLVAYHARDSR